MPVQLIQESARGEINQKLTAEEVIEALCENSLYEMTPGFSKVSSILAIIPSRSCSAERLKTYLPSTVGQNSLAIYRFYGNKVIVNSMAKIINIFGQIFEQILVFIFFSPAFRPSSDAVPLMCRTKYIVAPRSY